jgi:hypothetical protein
MVPHFFNLAQNRARVSGSALAPILVLFGTSSAFAATLYWLGAGLAAHVATGFSGLLILYFIYAYNHFMVKDPNRLHSEHHIQQMRSMELMGDSLYGGVVLENVPAGNPHLVGEVGER